MDNDIKLEDIETEVKDMLGENKPLKKISKLTEKLLLKVNGRFNAEIKSLQNKIDIVLKSNTKNTEDFIKNVNADLDKFKTRYEALYTDLVRRILLKMENRVFAAEIFEQASLDLLVEKIYHIEHLIEDNLEINIKREEDHIGYQAYIEDCAKKHEEFMQKHVNNFAKKQKEEQDVELDKEKEKTEAEDTGRDEDKSSDTVNTEDSGTTNNEDSGDVESTPSDK